MDLPPEIKPYLVQKLHNIRQNTPGSRLLLFSGTLFLEVWKRKQAELAYQWDVEQFEENEPDRPEFYGTKPCVVSNSVGCCECSLLTSLSEEHFDRLLGMYSVVFSQ